MTVFIVAEAGVNHLGERSKMLALCDAAKKAGADAVKFQAYNTPQLLTHRGQDGTKPCGLVPDRALSLYEFLRKCELTDADLDAIAAHCKGIGLKWFCSVFDPGQVERVLSRGACCLKVGHAEADYAELREACWQAHTKGVVTWISNPEDIEYMGGDRYVYCIAEYPAKSLPRLNKVDADIGFSSHYQDYRIPAAAALRGAAYIEAHLMLGNRCWKDPAAPESSLRISCLPGAPAPINAETMRPWEHHYSTDEPEREWSLSPTDFWAMVKLIREYETWL